MPLNKWPIRSPNRTSLYNKHGGRLSFAGKQLELTIAKRERTCTGNFAAISNKLTQKTSVWKTKKLGITRQVQEGAGIEEKQATSSLCPGPNREVHRTRTGFTRLPVLDRPDYFGHDRGRGKYTERVCSTERREEAGGEERVESGLVECGSRSSREAYSIEREEVLLLRQNLQGSQHAAKREAKIRTRCIQFHRAICHWKFF